MTESYLYLENYDLALEYNKLCETLLIEKPNLEFQTSVYRLYGNLFKKKKDYKTAMINYEMYHKHKDSLGKKSTQLKIDNNNNKNELKLKEQEIELQNVEIEALENEKTINNLKLVILTLFLLLLILLIFNLIKKNKAKLKTLKIKETKIKKKLDLTKNDSEKLAVNLTSSQDFVETFADKIKNTLPYIKDAIAKEKVSNVFKEIKSYSMIHNTKKDIRDYTNTVSTDYKLNLRTKYPSLNEREQQICYLVYLNLKNSEIANLLNLSIRSVENKRYAIRKKNEIRICSKLSKVLKELLNKPLVVIRVVNRVVFLSY
jgi:DNA-binding CsgD family transcriptional regulator